jgi:hypothetical protein
MRLWPAALSGLQGDLEPMSERQTPAYQQGYRDATNGHSGRSWKLYPNGCTGLDQRRDYRKGYIVGWRERMGFPKPEST